MVTFRRNLTALLLVTGMGLSLYVMIAILGFVSSSAVHYTNFVLVILILSGIVGLRMLVDEKIKNSINKWWYARLALVASGTILGVAGAAYIRFHALRLVVVAPFFESMDFWAGVVFVAGMMLLNWFHWGWILTTLIVIIMAYFFYGHLIPVFLLQHPEYDLNFTMNYIGLGLTDGIFWMAPLAADTIYFLVLFAAILIGVGMLRMVIEIGKAAGSHVRGGAAFPAVIGSGIVASVMGQAATNVVLTGRLTIPMMIRYGFRKEMAGAIEATASTCGQIMPPVLGLAGFIIAVFLNRPYIEVALAALIPALLFLTGVTVGVVAYAYRERLPRLSEPVDWKVIARLLPSFLISFGAVLFLLVGFYSPSLAGLAGIVLVLLLAPLQGKYRPTRKQLYDAFDDGLVIVTVLSLLVIAIGPLAQTFSTTALAGRLGVLIVDILPDSLFLMLVGAMVTALFLGMGMPTPVAYIIVSLTLVPFLQQIGVEPLSAHFFVFYFAVFSTLTPPVAISALAASKLSGGSFLGTTVDAMKLMLATFIIPFAFIYHPEILSFPNLTWGVVLPVLLILCVQTCSAACAYGYFLQDLGGFKRLAFGLTAVAGFIVIVNEQTVTWVAFLIILVATLAWVAGTVRTAEQ